ncbi:conserved domain protein [Veillonella parvula ACS-068-V-Sch12]|uniref:hypothetical protein n=1 Tax=Veillonella parvula TaxID=29466 RepID=UPI00020F05BD|nr:hypothetical protein [Veillonella parvula]EGL76771.1 conserved domain protein [Veillonella parvula ACS-068-V-Sch12]
MLVKDESKFCWCFDGIVGLPKNSIKEAIEDYLNNVKDKNCNIDSVDIANPLFLIHELSGKRAIYDVIDYSLPQYMYACSEDYITQPDLCRIKDVHIEELSKELSKVYNDWEKRHGYDNQSYIVFTDEAKTYYISDYIK